MTIPFLKAMRRMIEDMRVPDISLTTGDLGKAIMVAGRGSGKSLHFGAPNGTWAVPPPSPDPAPEEILLVCDGNFVRASVSRDVSIDVTSNGSKKWKNVCRISLQRARGFAREIRRTDVWCFTLAAHDGNVESTPRGQGARPSVDRSRLRIRFQGLTGEITGVRTSFRRIRTFGSNLEAAVNKVVLDEVLGA